MCQIKVTRIRFFFESDNVSNLNAKVNTEVELFVCLWMTMNINKKTDLKLIRPFALRKLGEERLSYAILSLLYKEVVSTIRSRDLLVTKEQPYSFIIKDNNEYDYME